MKIYISATFRDLQKHRLAVLNILRRMGHQPVGMEDYVAEGVRPLSRCLDDVAACDAYLCIVAWRYGYVPLEVVQTFSLPIGCTIGKTSVTECEYRKAFELGKPILAFVLDADADWPSQSFDAITGEHESGCRIKTFRQELSQRHLVNHFRSAEELASLVSAAVYRIEMSRQMDKEYLSITPVSGAAFQRSGPVSDSSLLEIKSMLTSPEKVEAIRIDIGSGSDWWMTRLYFLCSMVADLTSIEIIVFEASRSSQSPAAFVGTVHPCVVKERLGLLHDKIKDFEIEVGRSNREYDLAAEVERRARIWEGTVNCGQAERLQPLFVTEPNLERWLRPYLICHSIDLDREENAALRMQRVLDWPMRFVPLSENGQFKQVVDKQALTEQVARVFVREQVSRALSTAR